MRTLSFYLLIGAKAGTLAYWLGTGTPAPTVVEAPTPHVSRPLVRTSTIPGTDCAVPLTQHLPPASEAAQPFWRASARAAAISTPANVANNQIQSEADQRTANQLAHVVGVSNELFNFMGVGWCTGSSLAGRGATSWWL